jgi:alpha-mannosidase
MVTAVNKSEDDNSLVVRFNEWAGKSSEVELRRPAPMEQTFDIDLMERSTASLNFTGDTVTVPTGPFEIKTVRVKLATERASREAR